MTPLVTTRCARSLARRFSIPRRECSTSPPTILPQVMVSNASRLTDSSTQKSSAWTMAVNSAGRTVTRHGTSPARTSVACHPRRLRHRYPTQCKPAANFRRSSRVQYRRRTSRHTCGRTFGRRPMIDHELADRQCGYEGLWLGKIARGHLDDTEIAM